MRSAGLFHPDLLHLIARAGHTDRIVLADAGLPIPEGVLRIELGICAGLPGLLDVLRPLLAELVVERCSLAGETRALQPTFHARLRPLLPGPVEEVGHAALKAMLPGALAVIRTGEVTPYANVVLHCGVNF